MDGNNINQVQTTVKDRFTNILKKIRFEKRNIYVFIILFILVIAGVIIAVNHNYTEKYNNLVNQGNSSFSNEEYDKAISYFTSALKMKSDTNISKKLDLSKQLNKSKKSFENGIQSMNSGNYISAIDNFKNVQKIDSSRYNISQDKINECEQIIIKQDIEQAQNEAKDQKYTEACLMLDNALKIQPANVEVIKLKNQYTQLLVKQQQEEQKKQEAEAKKQAEETAAAEKATAKANMSKAEYGTGVVGIAVIGVKTSKTVDTGYGTYQYFKDKNMQFLWIDIGAVNLASSTQHVNPNFFTLSTTDGMTVNYDTQSTFSQNNYFDAIDLPPNGKTAGWLIFGVPKGSEYILHYSDFVGQVDKTIIID